ncbi:MAG: cupredoxin domain-containing protein [Deltaproteobacteria bacterium]
MIRRLFFLLMFVMSSSLCAAQAPQTKEIHVEAFKYGYSPDPIVVKKGEHVRILATSRDVNHGFEIKEYGINAEIKKGGKTEIDFVADKAGTFIIKCSVFCGLGHFSMRGRLIVEE